MRPVPMSHTGTLLIVAVFAVGISQGVSAVQRSESPAFEIASVRENISTERNSAISRQPGGNFSAKNAPLWLLITYAYQIQSLQLVGLPDWGRTARWDISAKASNDIPPTPLGQVAPEMLMVRSLLGDRFRLAVHRETREMPIYALMLARSDAQPGPQLQRTPADDYCTAVARGRAAFEAEGRVRQPNRVCAAINGGAGTLAAGGAPMNAFARTLSIEVQRVVIDQTGLSGEWDFSLRWSPAPAVDDRSNSPSLFTALREQLGLKLEATNGPVEMLVIDGVSRPSEN